MPQQTVIASRIIPMPWWEQLFMYLGIVIGIIASAYLRGTITGTRSFPNTILLSFFVGIIVMPFIYDRIKAASTNAPGLVRFGLFVQNGFFWDALMEGAGRSFQI
jgi:hypothetical protein